MKTDALDFLLSGAVLLGVLLLSLGLTVGLSGFSIKLLGSYHVLADGAVLLLSYGIICGLLARVLLSVRPLRPGDFAMSDPVFRYWKLLTVIYEFGRGALLPFTTVFARPVVAMLFGARVGRNVALGGRIADPSLVTIGDNAILGHNSVITPHAITSGEILLREVRIGRAATIGVNAVVMAGVEVGEGAIVTSGAVVPPHTKIPPGELWGGMPARKIKELVASDIRA